MDSIKNAFGKITKSISKSSGDLLKSTKTSVKLATAEERLTNLYIELGKKVHEIYMYGGTLGRFFDDKYLEIVKCEDDIAELTKQLELIKGTKICPKCKKTNTNKDEFCSKCGAVLKNELSKNIKIDEKELSKIEDKIESNITIQDKLLEDIKIMDIEKDRYCNSCGLKNSPRDKFCLSCGKKL